MDLHGYFTELMQLKYLGLLALLAGKEKREEHRLDIEVKKLEVQTAFVEASQTYFPL